MTMLITAALAAPLVGVLKRWPDTLHAVKMEEVVDRWEKGTFWSACGITGLRLLGSHYVGHEDQGLFVVAWPPRVSALPDGCERCRDCWVATGKKRPRSQWTRA